MENRRSNQKDFFKKGRFSAVSRAFWVLGGTTADACTGNALDGMTDLFGYLPASITIHYPTKNERRVEEESNHHIWLREPFLSKN